MTTEEMLKELILDKYGSLYSFAEEAGLPYTSVVSVINRGILNSGYKNVSKICETLNISIDGLCEGRIIPSPKIAQRVHLEAYLNQLLRLIDNKEVDFAGAPLTDADADAVSFMLKSMEASLKDRAKNRGDKK